MATTTVRVKVYDRGIQALFEPSGDVGRHVIHIGGQAAENSKNLLVPGHGYRTGELRRSVRSVGGIMSHFAYKVTVRAGAHHAMWVNEGTGTIYPKTGKWLAVGKREGHVTAIRASVKGQDAQKFLQRGMSAALVANGYSPIE